MTAGDILKGASFVFSINRSFQLEDLTQSYIAGMEKKSLLEFTPSAKTPRGEFKQ